MTETTKQNGEITMGNGGNDPHKHERRVGIAALLTAVLALFVSFWQGHIAREHNKLTVAPMISFNYGYSEDLKFYGYQIKNQGLGPAIIHPYEIYIDGKQVCSWDEAISKLAIDNSESWIYYYLIVDSEEGMLAGKTTSLFGVEENAATDERRESIQNALSHIGIRVKFCSVYEDCKDITIGNPPKADKTSSCT